MFKVHKHYFDSSLKKFSQYIIALLVSTVKSECILNIDRAENMQGTSKTVKDRYIMKALHVRDV